MIPDDIEQGDTDDAGDAAKEKEALRASLFICFRFFQPAKVCRYDLRRFGFGNEVFKRIVSDDRLVTVKHRMRHGAYAVLL